MKKTAESKVAESILQESKAIEVGGKVYKVASPSIGTLIKISEFISHMPEMNTEAEDPIGEALRVARDCGVIADVFATMIIGAKKPSRGVFARIASIKQSFEYKKTAQRHTVRQNPEGIKRDTHRHPYKPHGRRFFFRHFQLP